LTETLSGKLELESEPGKGTEIRFTFPRVAISSALPDEERNTHPNENFNQLRASLILVVDDIALNRELVLGFLEGSHHRLIQASTGREAVDRAKELMPDIVLMDIRMPDLDGEEALEKMRADEKLATLPVIAVTASSMLGEERELRTIFDGYIRKPFSHSVLFRELALFLPPADDTSTATPGKGVSAESTKEWKPENPEVQTMLVTRLRELQATTWTKLVESLGIRETSAFGSQLLELAKEMNCHPLDAYANQLVNAVEAFDINTLEECVRAYPELVDRLADAQSPHK
jgi:CheY-like chemotaxis protein